MQVLHRLASIDCYDAFKSTVLPQQNFAALRMTYSRGVAVGRHTCERAYANQPPSDREVASLRAGGSSPSKHKVTFLLKEELHPSAELTSKLVSSMPPSSAEEGYRKVMFCA